MPNTTITCGDGFELGAYEASPSGAAKGAVVVIQEIFGVNSHIRSVVDGYAEAGFYAIAPAIFDRLERDVQLGYTDDDMTAGIELAFQKLDMSQTLADLQATIDAAANHGKVGVVGYCWGGAVAWIAAATAPVSAAVSYYGARIPQYLDLKPACPMQFHYGERDASIPPEAIEQVRQALPSGEFHLYPAGHGFNCTDRTDYHAASAQLAFERSLAFLGKHVG